MSRTLFDTLESRTMLSGTPTGTFDPGPVAALTPRFAISADLIHGNEAELDSSGISPALSKQPRSATRPMHGAAPDSGDTASGLPGQSAPAPVGRFSNVLI